MKSTYRLLGVQEAVSSNLTIPTTFLIEGNAQTPRKPTGPAALLSGARDA